MLHPTQAARRSGAPVLLRSELRATESVSAAARTGRPTPLQHCAVWNCSSIVWHLRDILFLQVIYVGRDNALFNFILFVCLFWTLSWTSILRQALMLWQIFFSRIECNVSQGWGCYVMCLHSSLSRPFYSISFIIIRKVWGEMKTLYKR